MTRLAPALCCAMLLAASCAAPQSQDERPLSPVWAVGPDRLLELDPDAKISASILPMYGGMDRDKVLVAKVADTAFINATTKQYGSREAAAEKAVEQGIRFYRVDNYKKAMMRFNQAWLLDETNPGAFHGYAVVYQDHGNYVEAGFFAEKALELGLAVPIYRADCAFMVLAREGELSAQLGGPPSEERIEEIRSRTEFVLSAAATACAADERGYVEGMRLRCRMMSGMYDKAWESVASMEALGEPAPPELVAKLKSLAPRRD